jgi:glutamate dehydrogenase
MTSDIRVVRQDLIDTLKTRLKSHFPESKEPALSLMIQKTFEHLSLNDLKGYSETDLAGLSVSLWQHLQTWDRQAPVVKVFNPDIEQHEWQSTHTIVLALCPEVPFVLDSMRLALERCGARIHTIMHSEFGVVRDDNNQLVSLGEKGDLRELMVYFEIDRETNPSELAVLEQAIHEVLADVTLAVGDFKMMLEKTTDVIEELAKSQPSFLDGDAVDEVRVFMKWLGANHFTFLAYDEYEIVNDKIKQVKGSALGLFKKRKKPKIAHIDSVNDDMSKFVFEPRLISFHKSGVKSTVHRYAYSDYILIKKFNKQGDVIGGRRFLGLFTSSVYNNSPQNVPVVRRKIALALEKSGFKPGTHNYKELTQILFSFPRDELIQCTSDELLAVTSQVLAIQERRQIRLFLRKDPYGRFVSALLYIPKDIYNTRLRENVRKMLMQHFDVDGWDFTTFFSESILARSRFVFRLKTPIVGEIDFDMLEKKAINIARQWTDELRESLTDALGEEVGVEQYNHFEEAFPTSYREHFSARVAVTDIQRIQALSIKDNNRLAINFYRSQEPQGSVLKLKIFHYNDALLLSDLIPVLENLGLKVVDELPFRIRLSDDNCCYIYDFSLLYDDSPNMDPTVKREIFNDAFINVWYGKAENDLFNRLALKADLTWREVAAFRGYAKYMKQLGFSFSPQFIAETLLKHGEAVDILAWMFAYRFNPKHVNAPEETVKGLKPRLDEILDKIQNLSEDKIIRKYYELIHATMRTNFYQLDADGQAKEYISFKFSPKLITEMPLPKPMYEIFVYAPHFEGVHLRGGKVARGGLRWSDRIEDFRTEVLGLVKAQQVKNAVIVPVGAKGGFVAKQVPVDADREWIMANGIACYKMFIRGLLDITDNIIEGAVVPPTDVVRFDKDDPYLVVAADKGTATFSDIANEVAIQYNHWLGDAFASGGSNGYDHKKMGITAKGAWVSVQRHFRELGLNTQQDAFTVVGIGDMAGDVFGNGLLRSDKAKLIAAFNHLHIFIDPKPNMEATFAERQRLFDMPRSSWADFNKDLISKGGGIFLRAAKSIPITAEMKARFNIAEPRLTPNELIVKLLMADVDLLWNGGIGTYVKSRTENHIDVGDKANDAIRINGEQLGARVIGEGGNLGMTQLGRVEFALKGGRLFTDFIDNAGGVDCSDHEVNIKILLDGLVAAGDLTVKQRNNWLLKMTDDISHLVLTNNYRQAQALSLSMAESGARIEEYRRLINQLEESGKLNRELEFIPSDDVITERKVMGVGLTAPELAVLISYGKGNLKEQLIASKLGNDENVTGEAFSAFPDMLVKAFEPSVYTHRLKNEIVATQVSNDMFNHMGITYLNRLQESTGATVDEIAKAYLVARELFDLHGITRKIEALDYIIDAKVQIKMMQRVIRSVRRGSRWLVKNNRLGINVEQLTTQYADSIKEMANRLPDLLLGDAQKHWQTEFDAFVKDGVPEALASQIVSVEYLYNSLGVISVTTAVGSDLIETGKAYFNIGNGLNLVDFVAQLNNLEVASHWQARARESYRDDIEWQQRRITQGLLMSRPEGMHIEQAIYDWMQRNEILVLRWHKMVKEVLTTNESEFSMYAVAIRELLDLSQAAIAE